VSSGVPGARSLEQMQLDLVERLRLRRPEALEAVVTYMHRLVPHPTRVRDAQLALGWREVASACLDCGLLAIEQGDEWLGPIPPIVVVQERRAVRNGIDLSIGVSRYLAVYRLAWDFVLEELGYSDISDRDRTLVLRQASMATMSLLTQLLGEVTDVHVGELKSGMRTSAQREAGLMRRILAGERINEREMDYDFDVEHVGVIGWGEGAVKALAVVADRLGYQRWIVSNDDGTVWAWLGTSRGCAVADIKKALDSDTYAQVFAAIGEPASKIAGFRDTHGLAQGAYLVAQLSQQRITRYADVAREARALQDPLHAKWLMRTYVTPVVEHRDGATLLKILEKFYEAARNVDKAAKLLDIGRHTVERRLDKVGEIIGRELRTCHTEMEGALRLAQLHESSGESIESPWP
jgi:PucR C-terminal helix-turn-helix domain/GGDEF-like domain